MDTTSRQPVWDVFVSCTGDDRSWVRPIVDRLEQHYRVFLDERSIVHGSGITESIRVAIGSSRVFVACYSPAFTTRQACQWELLCAYLAVVADGTITDRIVVVNPTDSADHIEPVELRDARFMVASRDDEALMHAITARLDRLTTSIGPVPHAPAAWWPRRRFGSSTFIGRIAELWAIHSMSRAGDYPGIVDASRPRIVQVRSLGGVGKSLLVEEYALRFAPAYPGGVFWFDAGGDRIFDGDPQEALASHYRQLLAVCHLLGVDVEPGATLEQLQGRLGAVLEQTNAAYLWILDDVPDRLPADVLASLMPPGSSGRVVMTTRFRGYDVGAALELDVLTLDDAMALLLTGRADPVETDTDDARQLAHELGRHALALDLARGCLQGLPGIVSIADLRQALAEPEDDAFQRVVDDLTGDVPARAQRNIAATLWRSISTLDERGLDILRIASSVAAAPIPGDLFAPVLAYADSLPPADARMQAATGIRQTELRSLVGLRSLVDGDALVCLIHPLVSRTMRLYSGERNRRSALTDATISVLTTRLGDVADARTRRTNEALIPHARALANAGEYRRDRLELIDAVARFDYETGSWASALDLYQREYDLLIAAEGAQHPFTLQAAGNIASVLGALGRHEESLRIERDVLTTRMALLGDEDPVTLVSANNVALTLRELGRPAEARDLLLPIGEAARRALGPDHTQTVLVEANLANVLNDLGEHQAALDIQRRVLPFVSAQLGADHPQTLWLLSTMTTSLQGLGNIADAIRLGAQVHRQRRDILGPEHPDTLTTAHNVASLLRLVGRFDEARELQEQILDIRTRVLGPDHPLTLTTAHNLASTLTSLGLAEQAYELRRDVLQRFRRIFGDEHPSTFTALSNLAFSLRDLGRLEEAIAAERQAWAGRRRVLGDYHQHTLASGEHLHMLTGQLGLADEKASLDAYLSRRPALED